MTEITDADITWFSNGQCHALALALHELTGWPLIGSCWEQVHGLHVPGHLLVCAADGHGLGIHGAHSQGEHPDPVLNADDWAVVDTEFVSNLQSCLYDPADLQYARPFARLLADRFVAAPREPVCCR